MGLLSALPFSQLAQGYGPGWGDYQRRQQQQQPIQYRAAQPTMPPQLPSLTAPMNGQPMGPDPFAPAPVAPPVSAMPQMKEGPVQDPSVNGGFMGRVGKGLNTAFDSPLFALGMSLLGNADRGGNWAGVGQDVRAYQSGQREQQREANAERRAKVEDLRDETQFGWATEAQQREAQRRQRITDWANRQTDNPFAAVDPTIAFEQEAEARALAGQPMTPAQQAELALQRRGQDMQYAAQMANLNRDRPLRGPDATLMSTVRESAARSQGLASLGDQFLAANAVNATGELSPYNPLNFVSPERASMRATSAQMRGFMRPPNSGATSDFEQRLYGLGAMQTTNTGPQNQAIGAAYRTQAQLDQARMNFFEAWAYENGNLYGAEQAFQQSPDFQRIRQDFTNRYGALDERPPANQNGTGQTNQQRQSFDTLPPASGFRNGQRITDSQTNREFEVRNGQWVPVQRARTPQQQLNNGNLR